MSNKLILICFSSFCKILDVVKAPLKMVHFGGFRESGTFTVNVRKHKTGAQKPI